MEKLFIEDFKAFSEAVDIELTNCKNLLIYGENGSGKSSVYEALRYIFFKDLVEGKNIPVSILSTGGAAAQAAKDTLRNSFNNRQTNNSFQIKINDTDWKTFHPDYDILMISQSELQTRYEFEIGKMISNLYCTINDSSFSLSSSECEELEFDINFNLEEFLEDVRVSISNNKIDLNDPVRGLAISTDFSLYFNEAKLNIIMILLYFIIFQYKTRNSTKKRIVILDDIVSSLDSANRVFLIKYLLNNFNLEKDQIIFMTHNTGFYNLMVHQIKDASKWMYLNLYEIGGKHKCYINAEDNVLDDIESRLKSPSVNINEIGNLLRKKFESLLHQYAMLFSVNALEENRILIDRLSSKKVFYHKIETQKDQSVYDLIDKIDKTINSTNKTNLDTRIKNNINKYKIADRDVNMMKDCLKNLKLYLKVTMHPLSHYSGGIVTNCTAKEIQTSLNILKDFERNLLSIKDQKSLVENL